MNRRTLFIIVATLAGICALGSVSAWAAIAPLLKAELEKQATHIVSAKVTTFASDDNGALRLTLQVAGFLRGDGIESGDRIELQTWSAQLRTHKSRIPQQPGPQGIDPVPRKGDSVTAYLRRDDGGKFEPIWPNGFTIHAVGQDQGTRPNILLILSDDHAKKALSCYGNTTIETPALDRLAREGMRFEHALTPNSFCTPSRAVVLTGKYSHKNGVLRLNQSFDGSQQTFPKLLKAAGYQTSLFGKWHLLSQPTGFDFYCVQKMQGMPVDPIVFETGKPWIPWSPQDRKSYLQGGRKLDGYNNDIITTEALRWLKEKRDPDKPFCLLLHPKPPHQPYKPPQKYEEFLRDVTIAEPATLLDDYEGRTPEAIQNVMSPNRIVLSPSFRAHRQQLEKANPKITRDELTRAMYQEYIKGYYRLVKSVDDNVARVLDYLDDSGLAENTLVIYTSDQGFSLGEHGFYNKQWMYEAPLHQPLLVRFPKSVKPGVVHDSMVNHVDLAPTILEYAGLPVPDDMQGHSLKAILEGKAERVRDASYYHFYEHGKGLPEMIGIRTASHKLIHYPGMKGKYQWELFDLTIDPEELHNLYGRPEHKHNQERLKRELRKLIENVDDPVDAPNLMAGTNNPE